MPYPDVKELKGDAMSSSLHLDVLVVPYKPNRRADSPDE